MQLRSIAVHVIWAAAVLSAAAAPPTVTITYPTPGFVYVAPINVPARAEASDPDGTLDIHRVEFYLNAITNLVATDFSAPFACVVSNLNTGAYTLGARVFDIASNSALTSVVFSVAASSTNHPGNTSVGYSPLPALGPNTYRGSQGGLYPGGVNEIPEAHVASGLALAHQITPLDPAGHASPTGRIVVISLGYSNAQQLFDKWLQLFNGVQASNVIFINGAQGGQVASDWANPSDAVWTNWVPSQLAAGGVTTNQVQVAYDMHATFANIWMTQSWPQAATYLESNIEVAARVQLVKFPNLKLTFWMTREYGGYAGGTLNPEPIAYETAFPIKWMIEKQLTNEPSLNFDPTNGPVVVPWMAWGPYTWADGLSPRYDGLTYEAADFVSDGVHPSDPDGRTKLAQQVLDHMQYSPYTRSWFNPGGVAKTTNITDIAIATNFLSISFPSIQYLRYDIQTAVVPASPWATNGVVYGNGSNVSATIGANGESAAIRLELRSAP